jgi:CHAT domain-containing protein/Tfp pilus assembly protein PilF
MKEDLVMLKNQQEIMEKLSIDAWSYLEQNKYVEAIASYAKAIEIAQKLNDKVAQIVFYSYLYLAERGLGNFVQAKKYLFNSLEILQKSQDLPQLTCCQLKAHVYYFMAEYYLDEGRDQLALSELLKSLGMALECNEFVSAEIAFGKIGQIYLYQGNYEAACEMFRRALDINPESDNQVAWLALLGQSLKELGELVRALKCYKTALSKANEKGDIEEQAKCLISEGLAYYAQDNWQESLSCFEKAMLANQEINDNLLQALVLTNMGNAYLKLGKLDKAEELCKRALQLAESDGDKTNQAAFLDSLGDCLLEQGKYEDAFSYYDQAFHLAKEGLDRIGERTYLANLGKAAMKLGKGEMALEYLGRAINLFEEEQSRIRSNDLKVSFAGNGQDMYKAAVEVCLALGKRSQAIEYVGKAKSRAILDLLSNSPIDISDLEKIDDKNIAKLLGRERDLKEQIVRLEKVFAQEHEDNKGMRGANFSKTDISKLYQERREIIEELMLYHPNYTNLISVQTLPFGEIQSLWRDKENRKNKLDKNTAIIEFFFTPSLLLSAAIWDGQTEPDVNILTDNEELLSLSSDINDFIEMTSAEGFDVPISLSQRLYQRLLQNIVENLPGHIDRFIVIPHGILHHLPFAALYDGNGYLIERFVLSYLPTVSIIPILFDMESKKDSVSIGKYLVSVISDYSHTRDNGIAFSARFRSSAGLQDLTYTISEGKNIIDIANKYGGEVKLLANEQVKENFISSFANYPIVHFAGHAIFNPDEPLASGLVLSDGSVLTAASILQDKVLKTKCGKLLVLSACQTGVNKVTAGGDILGLSRTLMYAGMPNLILSLWEVADNSTAELMQNLYSGWQAGKTTIALAMAGAQRKVIADGRSIHAWAPFVHFGIG